MMLKIGHRGACGYEPENTLRSFRKAMELGVDMIELDVHLCKTGEIVVLHDTSVNRTTNGRGFVSRLTWDKIRTLDAGMGEKIPSLEEVLELLQHKTRLNVEIKKSGTGPPVCSLLERYIGNRGWTYDDFIISSFNHRELARIKRLNPRFKLAALTKRIPVGYTRFADRLGVDYINLSFDHVNKKFIDEAHSKGYGVMVYTVNEPKDIDLMISMGVDGIFSNFPDRLRR